MRILYIGSEPVPGNKGGSIHFMEVSQGLAKLGHEVVVCVPKEKGMPGKETWNGIKIIRTGMKIAGRTIPVLAVKKWSALKKVNPDIIMERFVSFGGIGALLAKKLNIPLVLEVNSPHTEELLYRFKIKNPLITTLFRKWRNFQYSVAAKVLVTLESVVPEFARDRFCKVEWAANCDLFDKDKTDVRERDLLRVKLGLRGAPVVVYLGSFRNWHGVTHLSQIVSDVISEISHVKFLLIGDGPERQSIEAEIKAKNLEESVVFAGEIPYSSVPAYLSLAEIGIAPYDCSEYPPLERFGFFWSPLKIFEYMSCSLPVVTIDIDPLNNIVKDGKRGCVVSEGDWGGFSKKIIKMLESSASCRMMGESAKDFVVANYSWKKHVEGLDMILTDLHRQG